MSMRLRPILALSIVLAWLPTLGHALGLGEIKLKSGLNQPMVAEIELLQMRDLGPNEVLPSLASPEDFERAGVSRDFFLTDMRFEVQVRPDGTAFVLVTTRKPVREPFVNFLMEVLWPAGRLLREYTLLMDPPVYADKVADAITAPAAPTLQRPTIAPAPQPLPRPTRPEVQDPVTTVRATAPTAQPLPRPTVRPTPPPPPVAVDRQPVPRPAAPTPTRDDIDNVIEETYTTKSNDALWNIATLWRPTQDVTVQQTMLAIQRKNPEAFANDNINQLKKGQVLRAPSAQEVREITREEAVAQVAAQERRWRERLARRSGATPEVEQPALSDSDRSRQYAPETGAQGGRITLASGAESATGESGSSGEGRGGKGLSALEVENELDRITSEKLEAESRVAELDALLTQNDSIISLQNEQIARLRERLKELEEQANQGPGAMNDAVMDGKIPGEQPIDGDGLAPDLTGTPIGPVTPPVDTPVNTSDSPVPTIKEPASRRPVEAPKAPAFYENPIYIGIAVGAVVVAGLVFFIFRRRDDDDEFDLLDDEELEGFDEEDEDLLSAEGEVPLSEIDDDDATIVGQAFDDQIGDPSDVISEADIFMAYGRFPEAVKLLQSAIDNDPNHPEVYLKLLEVFVETKDGEGFIACESQMQQMPFYGDVADRVRQLRQEYGGDLPAATAGDAQDSLDLGLQDDDFSGALGELDDGHFDDAKTAIDDEDFGLSPVDSSPEDALGGGELQAESGLQSLADLESSLTADFSQAQDDLGALDEDELDLGLDDVHATGVDMNKETLTDDLSFDEPADFDPSSLAADLDDALGVDESDMTADLALPTADVDFSTPDDDGPNGGDLADLAADLDLAFDESPEPVAPTAAAANVPDNDFMADADEAATKLDLARAYIDMGDRAGARDILDEVVQEGNAEQKEEAKALLKKVG